MITKEYRNKVNFKGKMPNIGIDMQKHCCRILWFEDKQLGKANPYGIYAQTANAGCAGIGTDNDTAEFAFECIRRWWLKIGIISYLNATEVLITADCGGSNGYHVRLYKVAMQALANETGLRILVCHFPPGISKWNKIEHGMFCCVSINWRGRPPIGHEVIVKHIVTPQPEPD